ncbi:MAG: hypothetical protein EBR94_10195 [Bacteroidetes bacterium]|nr:hypothetical protein [Bacteroidota bacterium]
MKTQKTEKTQKTQARQETKKDMKTLVIHPIDPTTDFLIGMYEGQTDYTIHGLPGGLMEGFRTVIDQDYAVILRTKFCIGIWCYACVFFERHALKGYYTGMMISEVKEATIMGIKATEEEIKVSNAKFVKAFRAALEEPHFLRAFKSRYYPLSTELYRFNWERVFTNDEPAGSKYGLFAELKRCRSNMLDYLNDYEGLAGLL